MGRRPTILGLILASLLMLPFAAASNAMAGDPQLVGTCALPEGIRGFVVAGDYAYATDWGDSLWVVDISDPAAPVIVGTCAVGAPTGSVAVAGGYAYLLDWANQLQVIDVSTPTAPVVVGSCAVGSGGLSVDGDFAYVANGGSGSNLAVVDVSSPTAPVLVGSCETVEGSAVAAAGGYAYVVGYMSPLQVIDVSTPTAPVVVGSCLPPDGTTVTVSGLFAYVGGFDGLAVVDVGSPTAPVVAGSHYHEGGYGDIEVAGDFAYVACGSDTFDQGSGLKVLDVGTPAAPRLYGSWVVPYPNDAAGVAVSGNHAYVSASGSLYILDLGHRADAKVARLIASAKPAVVAYNGTVTVTAELRDALGASLPGRTLVLQTSLDGTAWSDLRSVGSATGTYSTRASIVRKTYFRWSFAGDETYADAVSAKCSAISRAKLTPPAVPSVVRPGVKYVRFGYLWPQHESGRAPITVSFYRFRSGSWRSMGGFTSSRWDNVSGATRYGVVLKMLATHAGRWRVRAMHRDSDHAKTYSAWRYFVVR